MCDRFQNGCQRFDADRYIGQMTSKKEVVEVANH
jgi:hypothetical protein